MTCARSRRLLPRYHDGLLDPRSADALCDHLAICAACTGYLAALRRSETRIARALTVSPSPAFREAVLRAAGYPELSGTEASSAGILPPVSAGGPARSMAGGARVPQRRPTSVRRVFLGSLTGAVVAALMLLTLSLSGALLAPRATTHLLASGTALPRTAVSPRGYRSRLTAQALPTTAESPARSSAPASPGASRHATETAAVVLHPTPLPLDHAAGLRIVPEAVLVKGAVHGPLWSHDSASLLYLLDWLPDAQSGWYTGVLFRRGPSGAIRLAAAVRNYAWSPDDREIAYTTQAPPGSAFAQDLHLVGADGRGDRVICGVDRAPIQYVGSLLIAVQHGVLVAIAPQASPPSIGPLAALPPLAVADEDTAFYALSPDGRYLAYQDRAGLRLWDRSRLSAGRPVLILHQRLAPYRESSFHFSWDSRLLIYSIYDGRYTMLYRLALPSGTPVALNDGRPLHGPIDLVGPLSPTGGVASIRIGGGAQARNYVIDTLHGAAHALFPPSGVGPVGWWSPDGRRLVYTVYRGDDAVYTAIARVIGPGLD